VPEDVAYCNTANLSRLLRRVRHAGESGLARRATPWQVSAETWFTDVERLRHCLGRLLATGGEAIGLIPSTSYGLAIAVNSPAT
jgi:hypothetical protein